MFARKKKPCLEDKMLADLAQPDGFGFERAVSCLYELCRRDVLRWLRGPAWLRKDNSWLFKPQGSTQDAEDSFQEAVMILIRLLRNGKVRLSGTPCQYLRKIAGFVYTRTRQKLRATDTLPDDLIEFSDIDRRLDWQYALPKIVAHCLSEMGGRCRDLISDYYVAGLSLQDMAAKYRYADEHSASVVIARCFRDLKERISGQLKHEP
jgi:DNA-directed RNA polymerase specialized sigma24 family protein